MGDHKPNEDEGVQNTIKQEDNVKTEDTEPAEDKTEELKEQDFSNRNFSPNQEPPQSPHNDVSKPDVIKQTIIEESSPKAPTETTVETPINILESDNVVVDEEAQVPVARSILWRCFERCTLV